MTLSTKSELLIVIFILLSLSPLKSQTKQNSDTTRIYEFSVSEYPQRVRLIEFSNKTYQGVIITKFYKGGYGRSNLFKRLWKTIWNKYPKEIVDSAEIDPVQVKKLMDELKSMGVETIMSCDDDAECRDIGFLDGGGVTFKISTNSLKRKYSFQGIHKLKSGNLEKTSLRQQVQKLVTTIDGTLNFDLQFKKSKNKLPKGRYFYSGYGFYFVEFYHRPYSTS